MVVNKKAAILASLLSAFLVLGSPTVAFADKSARKADSSAQKAKDKDRGKSESKRDRDKKSDAKKDRDKKSDAKKDRDKREKKDKDAVRKDRKHRDKHNRDWDHRKDRDRKKHHWDTHRRHYRHGYYGPGFYDDCGYYSYGPHYYDGYDSYYGGYDYYYDRYDRHGGYDGYDRYDRHGGYDDWRYYGPDACSHEYGDEESHFLVRLSGEEVVPRPGPRDASGTVNLDVDPAAGILCYRLAYDGIPVATGAEVRVGRAGHNGPVVVALDLVEGGEDGCLEADVRTLESIRDNPGDYYLRIDADGHPDGAMRGQLLAPDYRSGGPQQHQHH